MRGSVQTNMYSPSNFAITQSDASDKVVVSSFNRSTMTQLVCLMITVKKNVEM